MGSIRALSSLLIVIALAGCAPTWGAVTKYCPVLKTYSPEKQKAVADELRQFAAQIPNIKDFVKDYGSLRKGIRATGCP